jgi:hypothetical protein
VVGVAALTVADRATDDVRFEAIGYGINDVTFGFDMTGSRSLGKLNGLPGRETGRGKMLGEQGLFGKWSHLLGRSVAFWKSDTSRLYVQAKLALDGSLCRPAEFAAAFQGLQERMAFMGIFSYEPAWVTRVDVAVDARCRPADGKLLLDALEATRLPNGWRTRSVGTPRSTVYFMARASEHVKARGYCRNLKLKQGDPFGLIRLEAEERFSPKETMAAKLEDPAFIASLWLSRFAKLSSRVIRLAREVQALEIAERVERGEMDYKQGERMALFLELERLGLASSYYPKSVYASRRREAAKLGLGPSDTGAEGLDVNLQELLEPYMRAVKSDE